MLRKIPFLMLVGTALALSTTACDESGDDSDFRGGGHHHNDDDDDSDSDSDDDSDSDSDSDSGGHHGGGECEDDGHRNKPTKYNIASYNLHLQRTARFTQLQAGADVDNGRGLFGVAADLVTEDPTNALFDGFSTTARKEIVSNGRTCFTCHRGADVDFGMPDLPITATVPLTDAMFTGIDADAGGDPAAFDNINERALFKYRVNRFDPRIPTDAPIRQVFAWRKSPQLLNAGLNQGFLNDLRGRNMFETARGAVFSHTQTGDDRFDDLFSVADGNDMEAFIFSLFSDPALAALRDPEHPNYQALVDDPYLTVELSNSAERRGKRVFQKKCFACHNTPQTFGNLDNVEPQGNGERPPNFPGWAPAVSKAFNIGIAEANFHNLRFTKYNGPGDFEPITLQMAGEDGSVVNHQVEFDIGLAMTTARVDDIGRFKVPQLRNLAANAPYMHDNSLATIEDVVDYFCSDDYNSSHDGVLYPIHFDEQQRADLIAFLYAL